MIRLQDINVAAAFVYGFDEQDLIQHVRTSMRVEARQVAMYVARHATQYSLLEIARFYDRDHTTVIHNVRKIGSQLEAGNEQVKARVEDVLKQVVA